MTVIKWLFKMDYKLGPAAEILTGGRSLISKAETEVETLKLWAVCSITNNSVIKDSEGEVEHSHWRQRPLVCLWSHLTRSHKQEWIAWDQWGQRLSMSKSLAQGHVWNPEMVSWTWKLSLKRASYRWWSKWKRKDCLDYISGVGHMGAIDIFQVQ